MEGGEVQRLAILAIYSQNAIATWLPPGSALKLFVAAIALDFGRVAWIVSRHPYGS